MKYIVCGDIHLGHTKTPTKHIINSFKKSILSEKNKDIDVLFIEGDLFDRLLDLNSKEVHYIIDFFNYLLSYCYTNNILLRVLEGTPSHDWQQSTTLVKLNEIRNTDKQVNLKYFNCLDIEYMEEYNKYILYIPDEWSNDHSDIEKQIKEKLLLNNIQNVDIAILHGQFSYQLVGKKYTGFYYKEDYFLKLVKEYIHVGHYHMYTTHDRIIATGSLERLSHGEEHPKGYVLVDNKNSYFIENSNSYIYKTLNVINSTTLNILDSKIFKYPKGSHIRLLMSKDHPFNITFQELKGRYLDYHIKKLIKEHVSESNSVTYILTEDDLDLSCRTVLEGNVDETLYNLITSKNQLSELESSKLIKYLSIFKEINVNESST